jgi:hypothetical protein
MSLLIAGLTLPMIFAAGNKDVSPKGIARCPRTL